MLTKCTNVCSGLAAHPKHGQFPVGIEFDQFAVVDGPDTELSLDGRDEWRTLENGGGQCLQSSSKLRFPAWHFVMESNHGDIFLTSSLLAFDQPGCAVNANDQTAGDFWVERARVTGFVDTEDSLDPSNDLVRGWV